MEKILKKYILTLLVFVSVTTINALDLQHSLMLNSGVNFLSKKNKLPSLPMYVTYGIFLDGFLLQTGFGYKNGWGKNQLFPTAHLGIWTFSFGYNFLKKRQLKDLNTYWVGVTSDVLLGFNSKLNEVNFGASLISGKNCYFFKIGAGVTKFLTKNQWGGYANIGVGVIINTKKRKVVNEIV